MTGVKQPLHETPPVTKISPDHLNSRAWSCAKLVLDNLNARSLGREYDFRRLHFLCFQYEPLTGPAHEYPVHKALQHCVGPLVAHVRNAGNKDRFNVNLLTETKLFESVGA
jgi:hypothetical protein